MPLFYFVMVTLLSALGLSGSFPIAQLILHANICSKSANAKMVNSSGTENSISASLQRANLPVKTWSLVTKSTGAFKDNIFSMH